MRHPNHAWTCPWPLNVDASPLSQNPNYSKHHSPHEDLDTLPTWNELVTHPNYYHLEVRNSLQVQSQTTLKCRHTHQSNLLGNVFTCLRIIFFAKVTFFNHGHERNLRPRTFTRWAKINLHPFLIMLTMKDKGFFKKSNLSKSVQEKQPWPLMA
jgi:hypothetical protein